MDKITDLQKAEKVPEKESLPYEGEKVKVALYDGSEVILAGDRVHVLPYFMDDGHIVMWHGEFPAYQYRYKDTEHRSIDRFISVVSEEVKKGERVDVAVRRALADKLGIALKATYDLTIVGPFFVSTESSAQCHVCLVEVRYNDYRQTHAEGRPDGRAIKVSLGDIADLRVHDVPTAYLLNLLKIEYKL